MTTIERIYARLVETMQTELPGRRSADPFTFDHDPRDAADSWYIDPPGTESSGAVGGLESVTATFTIWISRAAGDDAAGAAVSLVGDLARLRHGFASLDVDDDGRVNVGERITTEVRPRGAGAVTVAGRVVVAFDYEATAEDP